MVQIVGWGNYMKSLIIAGLFFLVAIAIFVHQFITYGILWEWSDLSHEGWIIMFVFSGIALVAFKKG